MGLKRFLGVWFEHTWAVVPRKWIFQDAVGFKCYWPVSGDVEELSRIESVPHRRNWSIWIIEKPDISHDNYDEVTKLMVDATTASEWEGDKSSDNISSLGSSNSKRRFLNSISPKRSSCQTKNSEVPESLSLPRRSPRSKKAIHSTTSVLKSSSRHIVADEPSSSPSLMDPLLAKRKLLFGKVSVGDVSSSDEEGNPVIVTNVPITPTAEFNPELSTITQSFREESDPISFVKKKLIENNMLLMEILQKLNSHEMTNSLPISIVKTIPCPAEDNDNLKNICSLDYLVPYLISLKECTLSRTVTSMIKALMSRELALKYSMTGLDFKRQKTKFKFKGSSACLKIEEALAEIPDFNKENRLNIHRAIGIALKNSADWDGHRGHRKKSAKSVNTPPAHSTPRDDTHLVTRVGDISYLNL